MKILITGGCGFIGSHLANTLAATHEITVLDNFSTGKRSNIEHDSISILEGCVTDQVFLEKTLAAGAFDAIYHLAAIASVQECKHNPVASSEVNARSTLHLLELATKHNIENVVFASSAAVYGDHPEFPKRESSPVEPISIYGIDKYASEQYVMEYARLGKLRGTAFRFFNVFGPKQDPSSPYSGVLSIFHNAVVRKNGEELTIFGDGKQTRDFIYIKDLVDALQLPLENSEMNGTVYNAATGNETSLLDVVSDLETITKKKIKINFKEARQGDIKHSRANIERLAARGFTPRFSFAEGLAEYIQLEK